MTMNRTQVLRDGKWVDINPEVEREEALSDFQKMFVDPDTLTPEQRIAYMDAMTKEPTRLFGVELIQTRRVKEDDELKLSLGDIDDSST